MAWDARAANLTPDFETDATTTPERYYSRYVYRADDPRNSAVAHIVREVLGTATGDEVGIQYLRYNTDTDQLTTSVPEAALDGSIANSWRAPVLAVNPTENTLWMVMTNTSQTTPNPWSTTGRLYLRSSANEGLTWSGRTAIGGTDTYYLPSIAFGLDGTGFIVAHNISQARYEVFTYLGSGIWSSPVALLTPAHAQNSPCAVAVSHDGKAVAIVDDRDSSTNTRPRILYYGGTSWVNYGILEDVTQSAGFGMAFPQIIYDIRKLNFKALYSFDDGTNARNLTITRDGVPSALTTAPFNTPLSPLPTNWARMALDSAGNLHVLVGSGGSESSIYQFTQSTGAWTGPTTFDYNSQDDPRPSSANLMGVIHVDAPKARIFFTADVVLEAGQQEDVWSAENPEYIDITEAEADAAYGCIVGLAAYTGVDDGGNFSRRLVAYAGGGVYDDAGTDEFVGGLIYSGAFEPVPSFAVYNGDLYIADQVNQLQRWNPSLSVAEAAGADAPLADGVFIGVNRLWSWEKNSNVLYFSKLFDGTSWGTAGTLEADPSTIPLYDFTDGEPIRAGIEFFGARYLFSENGIVRVTGQTPGFQLSNTILQPFTVGLVSGDVGVFAKRTVVSVGKDVYFVSRKGVHSLATTDTSGAVEETYISSDIQPFFDSLDKSALPKAQAAHYRRRNWYVLSVPETGDGGKLKTLLVYDYAQGKWARWRMGFGICSVITRINLDLDVEELLVGTDEGYVVKLDQAIRTQELGPTDYTAEIQSAWIHQGTPRSHSEYTRIYLYSGLPTFGTVNLRYWIDQNNPVTETLDFSPSAVGGETGIIGLAIIGENFTIGADSGASAAIVDSKNLNTGGRKGRAMMFEVSCPTGDFELLGAEIQYTPGAARDTNT